MMVKCFWCGAVNEKNNDFCSHCKRKLEWSSFFNALLRPSAGYLLVSDETPRVEKLSPARTPVAVG